MRKLYEAQRWHAGVRDIGGMRGCKMFVRDALVDALFAMYDGDQDGVLSEREYEAFLLGIGHVKADGLAKAMEVERGQPYFGDCGVERRGFQVLYDKCRRFKSPERGTWWKRPGVTGRGCSVWRAGR